MESSAPLMDTIRMNNLDKGIEKRKKEEIYVRKWANKRVWIAISMGKQISETKMKNSCQVTVTIIWVVIFLEAFKWVGELLNENMVWLMNPVRRDRFLVNAVNCSLCFMHVHFIHEASPIRLSPAHSNIGTSLLAIASGFLNSNSRIALWKNDAL